MELIGAIIVCMLSLVLVAMARFQIVINASDTLAKDDQADKALHARVDALRSDIVSKDQQIEHLKGQINYLGNGSDLRKEILEREIQRLTGEADSAMAIKLLRDELAVLRLRDMAFDG